MSAPVDRQSQTAGRITCGECGQTAPVDRDPAVMMGTIATFWDAHRNCGRIYIDLHPVSENEAPSSGRSSR
jgi:hypothetical protein